MQKSLILILCTGNSCHNQIAEGILRKEAGDLISVESAGLEPAGFIHPKATQVMGEVDIGISKSGSKHLSEFIDQKVHMVITVCGDADHACPVFPGMGASVSLEF
jgi:arsenate reductase (thioredoxin)